MVRRQRFVGQWPGATSLALASTLPIGAAAAQEAFRIDYVAPEGCPTQAFFFDEVRARTQSLKLAESSEFARRLSVTIAVDESGSTGRLTLTNQAGERVEREVAAGTCEEVVPAIALVTALAVDALVRGEDLPGSNPAVPGEPPGPSLAVEPPKPPPVVEPQPPAALPPPPLPPPRPDETPTVPLAWELGALGAIATGVAPDAAYGLVGYAGVRPAQVGAWGARLGLSWIRSPSVTIQGRRARFELLAARAEVCPLGAELGSAVELRPCAAFEGGSIAGEGLPAAGVSARSDSALWVTPGLGVRLEGRIEGFLVLQIEGDVTFPLVRERFVFDRPETTMHEVPVIAAGALMGLGFLIE